MKQYRPNVDRQKWLYSMMKSPALSNDVVSPQHSKRWLPGGVRSVADAVWISDQIKAANEREYLAKLPTVSAEEAAFMLARFLTPKVAEAGLHHPEESVRVLSLGYLKELAEEGDPFARDILEK